MDSSGNVYVADYDNHLIRRIDSSGNVTTLAGQAGPGSTDGQGTTASFRGPYLAAGDPSGNVYNRRASCWDIVYISVVAAL